MLVPIHVFTILQTIPFIECGWEIFIIETVFWRDKQTKEVEEKPNNISNIHDRAQQTKRMKNSSIFRKAQHNWGIGIIISIQRCNS